MIVQKAEKRTFYIERRGTQYEVVKVWEKGAEFTQQDVQETISRVMKSNPDERIIAEQSISVSSQQGLIAVEGERADVAGDVAMRIAAGEKIERKQ